MKTELAPFYYRDNFRCLCDTVEAQYADLLSAAELQFLETFGGLSLPAQCLYVRLISRVGPWFRAGRLAYEELGDSRPLVAELQGCGLVRVAEGLAVAEAGALYTRQELLSAVGGHIDPVAVRDKPSLLRAIDLANLEESELLALLREFDGTDIVAPGCLEQVENLQLLFFGNRRQSLTDFVLRDLGVARYYPYALDRRQRLFTSREAVDEYLACAHSSDCWYQWRDDSGDSVELMELGRALLRMEVRFPSSRPRWSRLCNAVARELERAGELDTALALYAASDRHPCRERSARILERQGRLAEARALCEAVREQPWCEEEYDAAGRILPRLCRAMDGVSRPRARDNFPRLALRLRRGEESVEWLAAAALERDWESVRYVENRLMSALFGLVFWEQIFLPVPGAFHNPFQAGPSDMYDRGFRRQRREALATRMDELAGVDLREELVAAYQRYLGYQCHWVDWRRIDAELVGKAAAVIPRDHLLAVWERMLFDPRENRRGFPDLLALGAAPGHYCLIEVKAPGDALQESQKRWLRFFRQREIPARVAWVEWRDD